VLIHLHRIEVFYVLTLLHISTGKYLDTPGNDEEADCVSCGTGKYSTATGATENMMCQQCPGGKHLPTTGNDSEDDCVACAKGKYTPSHGMSVCTDCMTGKILTFPL
jgi:hypothetical protein